MSFSFVSSAFPARRSWPSEQSTGGLVVVNDDVLRGLQIPPEVVQQVVERQGRELLRWERA
jgi:predicted phosphoribosyltransferase